jgi:hypothetical protein
MACKRTYATLRIFSPSKTVSEISEILRLQPTAAQDRGELGRSFQKQFSIWKLSSERAVATTDTRDHIAYLLETLLPAFEELQGLRSIGCEMDVFCYFETDGQGGPSISSSLMKSLSDFQLDVTWDIYVA